MKPDKVKATRMSAKRLAVTLTVMIGVLLLLCAYFFSISYERLNESIEQERVKAVQEIGVLLSDRVESLRVRYLKYTDLYKKSIEKDAHSMEELRGAFADKDYVLLCMENGSFMTLSGERANVASPGFYDRVVESAEPTSDFISVDIWGECWGFFVGLDGVETEKGNINGFVLTTDDNEYDAAAVLPLYCGLGASYVVNDDGDVLIRPEHYESDELFDGENVLDSLREKGAPVPIVSSLQRSLDSRNEEMQFTVHMNDDIWLVQCVPNPIGSNIVISIPISKTAKETFTGMTEVTLLLGGIVLLISALLFIWTVYYIRCDHQNRLEQEKVSAKSRFMSKMSHDIRTPLNAIIGMNRLARDSVNEPEVVADYLDRTFVSCDYLLSLINDVLDMSKIESGKMTVCSDTFDMQRLLRDMISVHESSAMERGLELKLIEGDCAEKDYIGDALHIRQCLMNLLSNAIKFTPPHGSVTLSYSQEQTGDDSVEAVFTVEDTGIGMSEEFQKSIFTPFEQERPSMTGNSQGSGLGLSIVNSLVKLMDGKVNVKSAVGEGSTFTISLSLVTTPKRATQPEDDAARELPTGLRVLVAEDNETNCMVICKLLEKLGENSDPAANGKEALELFEASAPGTYALIFMDIQMPEMDGLQAAREIRASSHPDARSIPIVALSANAYREDVEQSVAAGMQGHVAKPVDAKRLKETIEKYCIK